MTRTLVHRASGTVMTSTTRLRDVERRFLQRNGWTAIQDTVGGERVWRYSHPRYVRAFSRSRAVDLESRFQRRTSR
jgi:hypothetical protein